MSSRLPNNGSMPSADQNGSAQNIEDPDIVFLGDAPPLRMFADNVIELEEEDTEADIDYLGTQQRARNRPVRTLPRRNNTIALPESTIHSFEHPSGLSVRPGSVVQIAEGRSTDLAELLFVQAIIKDVQTRKLSLRALPLFTRRKLTRLPDLDPLEVSFFVQTDRDDDRPWYEQGSVTVPVALISQVCDIAFSDKIRDPTNLSRHGKCYMCRLVMIESFKDATHRLSKTPPKLEIEYSQLLLSAKLIDQIISSCHGHKPSLSQHSTPAAQQCGLKRGSSRRTSKMSYVSAFCGGGCDSIGARNAGAKVTAAVDNSAARCDMVRLNCPRTRVICDDVSGILCRYDIQCRILTIAFPCQDFSQANTHHRGRPEDYRYGHLALSCHALIRHFKPDVVLLENVAGFLFKKHAQHFFTVLQDVAESLEGYNLRWKLLQFRDFGLAARRLRFVLIASRRGVPLPPFPEPTHGPGRKKLYTTVHAALEPLRGLPRASHNDPKKHCKVFDKPRRPYDHRDHKPIGCITTSGGEDVYHPSGKREFTIRELACINGMDVSVIFADLSNSALKQIIGNGIPPLVWEIIVSVVIKTLKDFDNGIIDADGNKIVHNLVHEEGLHRTFRDMSVASSRTISPEPPTVDGPSPAKRRRVEATTAESRNHVIDLTGDD